MKPIYVVGLFANSQNAEKILNSLQIAGLDREKSSKQVLNDNCFVLCIPTKDKFEEEIGKNIFDFYKVSKTFTVEDINLNNIGELIVAHSKAEIYEAPKIRRRTPHAGISSEVTI